MTECVTCGIDKPPDKFRTTNRGGKTRKCLTCNSKRDKATMVKDPVRYLYHLAHGRRDIIEFNLKLDYLRGLWDAQGGVCELSGLQFADFATPKDPLNPSLDRIDSSKGYVVGNVRFVLWGINNAMNCWGLETYLRIARAVVERHQAKV